MSCERRCASTWFRACGIWQALRVGRRFSSTATQRHESLTNLLGSHARGIGVKGADTRILASPTAFYDELLAKSASAQRRVVLSSLYLGTHEPEQKLVALETRRSLAQPDLYVPV